MFQSDELLAVVASGAAALSNREFTNNHGQWQFIVSGMHLKSCYPTGVWVGFFGEKSDSSTTWKNQNRITKSFFVFEQKVRKPFQMISCHILDLVLFLRLKTTSRTGRPGFGVLKGLRRAAWSEGEGGSILTKAWEWYDYDDINSSLVIHSKRDLTFQRQVRYHGGLFDIDIEIPAEYPSKSWGFHGSSGSCTASTDHRRYNPPKMKFDTKIWHPNISSQVRTSCCFDNTKNKAACLGM